MRRDDGLMEGCDAGTQVLADAVSACAEKMPAEARAAVHGRLVAAIAPEPISLRVRLLRPAIALMTAGTVLGGVSYAAAVSAPGDLLYPVKRTVASAYETARRNVGAGVKPKVTAAPGSSDEQPAQRAPKGSEAPVVTPRKPAAAKSSSGATPGPGVKNGSQDKTVHPKSNGKPKPAPKHKSPKKSGGSERNNGRSHGTSRPGPASKR